MLRTLRVIRRTIRAALHTDRITLTPQETAMTRAARIADLRERIARRALATINTPADAHILAVVRTGTVITVATHQPGERLPYWVDSYRLLTPADRAQEADWGWESLGWFLTDQYGADSTDEIPGLIAEAIAYANRVTLAA